MPTSERLARRRPSRRVRVLLLWLGTAAAYYVGARVGLGLALVKHQVTPLWPPTGIAVAALFLSRGRAWPGVALGAFIVNAPLGPTLPAAALIAAGNTLAPVVAYRLLRWRGFRTDLSRLRDAVDLVVLAALGAMLVSATVGTTVLTTMGPVHLDRYASIWWVWWAGDAMGVLLVAPLLLVASSGLRDRRPTAARVVELVAVLAATFLLSQLVFSSDLQLLFPVFPVLVWAALRFQLVGAAPAALITGVMATWYAVDSAGPFDGRSVTERMVILQAVNGCVAITSYLLAALTTERLQARRELEASRTELETRVAARTAELTTLVADLERSEQRANEAQELARIGSWDWDITADIVSWSDELYRLFGLEGGSGPRTYADYLAALHPDDREAVGAVTQQAYASGEPFAVDHRVVHRDGTVHWVHGRGFVTLDGNGEAIRMSGTAQDIDERRSAEEAAQKLREVADRRQRALELNDSIVQGLTVAAFSLQLGKPELAESTLQSTLEAARGLVSDLWGEHTDGAALSPGDLVRQVPAQLGSSPEVGQHVP